VGGDELPPVLDEIGEALAPGDRFLLCSDGLNKTVDAAALAALMTRESGDGPAHALIQAALANAARDNVTAVVVAPDPGAPTPW
jgi:protein phosphatase/serine/threonine-protein phosphatase Stp1